MQWNMLNIYVAGAIKKGQTLQCTNYSQVKTRYEEYSSTQCTMLDLLRRPKTKISTMRARQDLLGDQSSKQDLLRAESEK